MYINDDDANEILNNLTMIRTGIDIGTNEFLNDNDKRNLAIACERILEKYPMSPTGDI